MDFKALLAGLLGTVESLTPFVRDDGANYHADLKNSLQTAVGVAESMAEATVAVAPSTAPQVDSVLAAIEALGSHLADLTAIVHDVKAAVTAAQTAPATQTAPAA
jgi:hypothetical protein